jgi:hypothetical protein
MLFLAGDPDITPIVNLITTWIHIGQALVRRSALSPHL